jgi:hypothetical protein
MRNTIDGFYFLIWKTAGLLARDRMHPTTDEKFSKFQGGGESALPAEF